MSGLDSTSDAAPPIVSGDLNFSSTNAATGAPGDMPAAHPQPATTARAGTTNAGGQRDLVRTGVSVSWQGDIRSRRFNYVGPQAVHLLGYPLASWYDEGFWASHLMPDEREHISEQRQDSIARGHDFEMVYHMVASSGAPVLIREIATVTRLGDGAQVLSGIFLAVEEPYAIGEMPESVKAFAAFIGHELSQPVGAVLANAEAMQRLLRADPPRVAEALDALADIAGSARQASSIIRAMRSTAR